MPGFPILRECPNWNAPVLEKSNRVKGIVSLQVDFQKSLVRRAEGR
jgi:hypothetical protein